MMNYHHNQSRLSSWRQWYLIVLWVVVVWTATTTTSTVSATAIHQYPRYRPQYRRERPQQLETVVQIVNDSGRSIEIYWVDDHDSDNDDEDDEVEWVLVSPERSRVPSGDDFTLHALPGHVLAIQQHVDEDRQEDVTAQVLWVHVSTEEESEVVTITEDWEIVIANTQTDADEWAYQIVEFCRTSNSHNRTTTDTIAQCVQGHLAATIESTMEDISFHNQRRLLQGNRWENYACDDPNLETTKALWNDVWHHRRSSSSFRDHDSDDDSDDDDDDDEYYYNVRVLHHHPTSQIHVLDEFIRPEECAAILQASQQGLHRAKVHDGQGGNVYSEHRKAWQAGIDVDWENPRDPITRLSRRVYDYTNHVLGLHLRPDGQEGLMSIQYFGQSQDDHHQEPPDRYMPHCDDQCDGRLHKRGTRMATMVMYCEVPTAGGHTNFRNAGVHISPQVGGAAFFSYIDPHTYIKDNGFTSHSGCPVYQGNKKIVTQWLRFGVNQDNPWNSFNTLGVQEEEYDFHDEENGEEEDSFDHQEEEDDDDDDEGNSDAEDYDDDDDDDDEEEDEGDWANNQEWRNRSRRVLNHVVRARGAKKGFRRGRFRPFAGANKVRGQ